MDVHIPHFIEKQQIRVYTQSLPILLLATQFAVAAANQNEAGRHNVTLGLAHVSSLQLSRSNVN